VGNVIRPHDIPFVVGARYRVRRDFEAMRDRFKAGEELVYEDCALSIYHGCKGYFFRDQAGEVRSWDLYDGEDSKALWPEFFEPVAEPPKPEGKSRFKLF